MVLPLPILGGALWTAGKPTTVLRFYKILHKKKHARENFNCLLKVRACAEFFCCKTAVIPANMRAHAQKRRCHLA